MLLSLSLVILVGFLLAELSLVLRLPKVVGLMMTGILLGPSVLNLLHPTLLLIGPDLRQLALVIILLRAGLSLDVSDLKKVGRSALLLSFVPASFEIVGVMLAAHLILGLSWIDAALLGSILAAVSPAIVVPRMLRLMKEQRGTQQSIPQLIMAGASMDDIYVILIFTSLFTTAQGQIVSMNIVVHLLISIILGVLSGYLFGTLLAFGFKRFHYRDTTKVLVLLSISLMLVTVEHVISDWVPFSGLIAVLSLGITWLAFAPVVAQRLVIKYEKIWMIAELLLFVMVGAIVDLSVIADVGWMALVIIGIGLVVRSLGTLLSTFGNRLHWKERLFVVVSYLPKATVQASIGSLPLAVGLGSGPAILSIAVIAILVTAPLGAWIIDWSAPYLLKTPYYLA